MIFHTQNHFYYKITSVGGGCKSLTKVFALTWQHTWLHSSRLLLFGAHNSWAVKAAFSLAAPLCVCVTQLLPACCGREHIPRHGGHPSQRRVALVRRCHLPVVGTDLAWKERRSDSPATKIRPLRCSEKRLTAPTPTPTPTPASHKCTGRTKSKRAVGQSASAQLQPVSTDLLAGSQRVHGDWEGGEAVDRRGGGARAKPWFK